MASAITKNVGRSPTVDSLLESVVAKSPVSAWSSDEKDAAVGIAMSAVNSICLERSLHAIHATQGWYPFENLHGLFSMLAVVDNGRHQHQARTTYGTYLIPRLFHKALGHDTEYYTDYIPTKLTIAANEIARWRIHEMLDAAYEGCLKHFDRSLFVVGSECPTNGGKRRRGSNEGLRDRIANLLAGFGWGSGSNDKAAVMNSAMHGWWNLSTTLKGFTYQNTATTDIPVGIEVSRWLSKALVETKHLHWFLDGIILQLFHRDDVHRRSLIEHAPFERYMTSLAGTTVCQRKSYWEEVLERTPYGAFNQTHLDVVYDRWGVMDFTLTTELLNISTFGKPNLTTAELSFQMAAVFNNKPVAPTDAYKFHDANEAGFFERIIDMHFMPTRVNGSTNSFHAQKTKNGLKEFVVASDMISGQSDWGEFEALQDKLAPLRLGGWFTCKCNKCPAKCPADAEIRQEEALVLLPTVFSPTQSTNREKVIYTRFIPTYLMSKPAAVSTAKVSSTLTNMWNAAAFTDKGGHTRPLRPQTDQSQWTKAPDWWRMSNLAAPFTFKGTGVQQKTSFAWLNDNIMMSIKGEPTPTNWMIDGVIVQALANNIGGMNHIGLVRYADARVHEGDEYTDAIFLDQLLQAAPKLSRWSGKNRDVTAKIAQMTSRKHAGITTFQIFLELAAGRELKGQKKIAEDLALNISWVLGPDGPVLKSARTIERFLDDRIFGFGVGEVVRRLQTQRKIVPGPVSRMIDETEAALERHGNPLAYVETIEQLNQARFFGGDFVKSPLAAERNLVTAVRQLLAKSTRSLAMYNCGLLSLSSVFYSQPAT